VEIAKLIWECGFLSVSVNNIPQKVNEFWAQIKKDGILLTGGNDLALMPDISDFWSFPRTDWIKWEETGMLGKFIRL